MGKEEVRKERKERGCEVEEEMSREGRKERDKGKQWKENEKTKRGPEEVVKEKAH